MIGSRPNVLIVILDSARPEWISCYGSRMEISPNIDKIASEGILFETAISPSAWTLPAMASIFTGMLPIKHGAHDGHLQLDSRYPTLAEVFGRHGYDTAAFSDLPWVGPLTRLDRGFRTMCNMRRNEVTPRSQCLKAIARVHRVMSRRYQKTNETRVLVNEAIHWLEQRRLPGRPFLLYIHTDETHAPFLPPRRYRRRVTNLTARQMRTLDRDKHLYVSGLVEMAPPDSSHLEALARAEVAYFDSWLGRLLDRMRRQGLLDDTAVIITADHGENLGEHNLLRHGLCLYDTLLRVPLIIRPPGGARSHIIRAMVQLLDLFPTLLRMASIDEPDTVAECQGRELMKAIHTGQFARFVVSELYRPDTGVWEKKVPHFVPAFREKYDRVLRSFRTNTHKFIWSSDGSHELYNLVDDAHERENLIDEEAELAEEMNRELEAWASSFHHAGTLAGGGAQVRADSQVMARLRDLGYVQ